jgi:hypothetical protein
MDLPTRLFLLGMVHACMPRALHRPIAAGRVRTEPPARFYRHGSSLLSRLHRAIGGRLADDRPLTAAPGEHGWPLCVRMAAARLALLAATTRPGPQRLLPTPLGLALLARGGGELIRLDRPFSLPLHCIGQGSLPSPPPPTITGADLEPHLPGKAPRRTRQAQEQGGKKPVAQGPLTLGQEGVGEVMKGASATVAPGAWPSWPVVLRAPVPHVVTLAPGTGQRTLLPPQRLKRGVAGVGVAELVKVGEDRHG